MFDRVYVLIIDSYLCSGFSQLDDYYTLILNFKVTIIFSLLLTLYIYIYIHIHIYYFMWRCGPTRAMASSFMMFLDHTQRRITVGRTPLDERSARRRDLYLTTHNTHNRQTSMPPSGIRTHNLCRRAAADLRLRPRGYWDRHFCKLRILLLCLCILIVMYVLVFSVPLCSSM